MTAAETRTDIQTERFRVPASEIFLYMLAKPRKSWAIWLLVGLGAVLMVAGLVADMRLVAVGLMVWLALVPTAAFFMHYSEALSPSVAPNLLPHSMERIPGGYIMRVYRKEIDNDEVRYVESQIFSVRDADIKEESVSGAYRRLELSTPSLSILFLPLTPNP